MYLSASVQVVGFQNIRSGNQNLFRLCLLPSFQIELLFSFFIFTGLSGHITFPCCFYEIRPFLLINISMSCKFLILFKKLRYLPCSLVGTKEFSFLLSVQIDFCVNDPLTSYSVTIGGCFPWGKMTESWTGPLNSAEIHDDWSSTSTARMPLWRAHRPGTDSRS